MADRDHPDGIPPGHPATRAYVERRTKEGLSKKEIIRCLKRYVAREVYHHLRTSALTIPASRGGLSPLIGCRTPCWPPNDLPAAPGPSPAC